MGQTTSGGPRAAGPDLVKYPRTPHLMGSLLGPGDEDLSQVDPKSLKGHYLVVEEKLDGSNCAIRFSGNGQMFLQSRGHYLVGGPRERHFELLKAWTGTHQRALFEALGSQYVLYGEWLAAKHTVYYDALTHYLFEFDVLDTENGTWLDTERRGELLANVPVVPVPVLWKGEFSGKLGDLTGLVAPSLYKSETWRESLHGSAEAIGQSPEQVYSETDNSDLSEGLYIKDELDGVVIGRYKWVRQGFLATITTSGEDSGGTHWLDRPHLPNGLADGVDLYAEQLTAAMGRKVLP
jgi:hypothetical protein